MEINLKKLGEQEVESTTGTKKMRLSADSAAMVFQLFTKMIYSNPIGTVVREITSNCFDSHIEAGVDVPVIIRLSKDKVTNTSYISFIDYGVGMSPDRMENVYGVYFNSSKRGDNTQIGGFGIGGKTPLAYKRSTGHGEGEYDNSFNIITYFDGLRYEYLVFEGKESPEFSEPLISETTEHNGTEVRITVLEKDIYSFKKEMVRQLYYFENIIFQGFGDDEDSRDRVDETLMNEYQIVRGKSFLFRGSEYSQNVHVCLGRVAYPINYDVLGLNSSDYRFPIALKLEVGEIGVIASREALDYSEATIKILKKKIEVAKAEIIAMLVKQYDNIQTLEDYFKVKNKFGVLYMPNGESFNVGDTVKMKDVDFNNFKYNFMNMPNDKQLFRYFFDVKLYGKKIKTSRSWRYNHSDDETGFEGSYDTLMEKNKNLYYFEGEFIRKIIKQAWLKQQHTTYFTISKKQIVDKSFENTSLLADLFHVSDAIVTTDANGKEELTPYMLSLLELQDEYFEMVKRQCTEYNSVVVPQDYIDSRKANAKKLSEEFRNATIPAKIYGSYSSRKRIQLDSLFKLNMPIFYGTKDDEYTLRDAKNIFKILFNSDMVLSDYSEYNKTFNTGTKKKGILFLEIGKSNVRFMQYCKNAKHISKFNSTYMHRKEDAVIEYFQTRNFIQKFENINELYTCDSFGILSPAWSNKVEVVKKFIDKINKKSSDWCNYKNDLSKYYKLDNIKPTKEQQQFTSIITELEEMQELNKDVMRYIDVPYNISDAPQVFWDVLRKVLVY
jgi:hypothetical protein